MYLPGVHVPWYRSFVFQARTRDARRAAFAAAPVTSYHTLQVHLYMPGAARRGASAVPPDWFGWHQLRGALEQERLAVEQASPLRLKAQERAWRAGTACRVRAPRPRVFIYELPPSLLPPPTGWRYVRALKLWIEQSIYYEPNPFCADYFLVPSHPNSRESGGFAGQDGSSTKLPYADVGDLRLARAFGYIRDTFPFWNRSVQQGVPRHLMHLPCDHGPGDCAYTRPIMAHKYSPSKRARVGGQNKMAIGREEIVAKWGDAWEALNPASPARLVIFLQYNGWADGLRNSDGYCLNCFQPGLDIRMPSPEGHECGVQCGLHVKFNASKGDSWYIPTELQRVLLRQEMGQSHTRRRLSSTTAAVDVGFVANIARARRLLRPPTASCLFSWTGAVRGRSNPTRSELLKMASTPNVCIANTAEDKSTRVHKQMPSIPVNMRRSRFCYSPRGWDQGDSDRYLPALLYGCVPIMSDRMEAMPLAELPDMPWNESALAIERQHLSEAVELLSSLPRGSEERMRRQGIQMMERLLYTTFEFSDIPGRGVGCVGCAQHRVDMVAAATARAKGRGSGPRGGKNGMSSSECSLAYNRRQERLYPAKQPAHFAKLAGLGGALGINTTQTPLCGQASYFGETGARDAFEGLMAVLRQRLLMQPAPPGPEPWATLDTADGMGSMQSWPLTRKWFAMRKKWYDRQVEAHKPLYTLLQPLPPASQHRRALARAVFG